MLAKKLISEWKDEMQNILNFKGENIAWAIFQGQDGYKNGFTYAIPTVGRMYYFENAFQSWS